MFPVINNKKERNKLTCPGNDTENYINEHSVHIFSLTSHILIGF